MIAQPVGFFRHHKHPLFESPGAEARSRERVRQLPRIRRRPQRPRAHWRALVRVRRSTLGAAHLLQTERDEPGRHAIRRLALRSERSVRSIARASRLLVLKTRIEEALVRTAGATISDSAPKGLVGSVIPEYEGSAPPTQGVRSFTKDGRLSYRA